MNKDSWGCLGVGLLILAVVLSLEFVLPAELTRKPSRDAFTIMAFIPISFLLLNGRLDGIDKKISYIEKQIEIIREQ
jgi:hypothetical protein